MQCIGIFFIEFTLITMTVTGNNGRHNNNINKYEYKLYGQYSP